MKTHLLPNPGGSDSLRFLVRVVSLLAGVLAGCAVWLTPAGAQSTTSCYFPAKQYPPAAGVLVCTNTSDLDYGGGILVRDLRLRSFDRQATPPALGETLWHSCTGRLEMEVSLDGGTTWQTATGSAHSVLRMTHSSDAGALETYQMGEPLDGSATLGGGGGGGGGGIVLFRSRSSPASAGTMHIQSAPGGYMIDSFFDIYTEVSTDGGGSWHQAGAAARLELHSDFRPALAVGAPSRLLPARCDQYAMASGETVTMSNGMVIRAARHKMFGTATLPPSYGGGTQLQTFDSQIEVQVSTGGAFTTYYAPAVTQVNVRRLTNGGRELYENEMIALTASGGNLPTGVMIRESPTRHSCGLTTIETGDPEYEVDSFFDVWLEVSTDGGSTWGTAASGPARVCSTALGPDSSYSASTSPPSGSRYQNPSNEEETYPSGGPGVIVRNVVMSNFTGSTPLPPAGGFVDHTFAATVTFEYSLNGGGLYQWASGTATCREKLTFSQVEGVAQYFTTDLTALNLTGGTLPAGMMIRESPTKSSTGRLSYRPIPSTGLCMIDSFFDIYTEISLNSGSTWTPTNSAPLTVALRPTSLPPVSLVPPGTITAAATSPAGAMVTYSVSTGGGLAPLSLVCAPPSGSVFPPGDTVVNCTVTDSVGQQAGGSFHVVVGAWSPPWHFFAQNLLPPPEGLHVMPSADPIYFSNGVVLRDLQQRSFSSSVAPPALGAVVAHTCGSEVEFDLSMDGGASWSHDTAEATSTLGITHTQDVGGVEEYALDLTSLSASGGTLPSGVMIRESPTKSSGGTTRITPGGGGSRISSFFDVWLEVSTDGGLSWASALDSCEARLVPDPSLVAADETLSLAMPPPDDRLVSIADPALSSTSGVRLRNLALHSFSGAILPPAPDGESTAMLFGWADCDCSTDHGLTWQSARPICTITMRVTRWGSGDIQSYDTEMLQMDLSGGGLPAGVMIRESPTEPSRGFIRSTGGGAGSGADVVQSFFDIFTEVTIDGGATWQPATGAPMRLETRQMAAPQPSLTQELVPDGDCYASPPETSATFGPIVLRNLRERSFGNSMPFPAAGGLMLTSPAWLDLEISYDGGMTFAPAYAPVQHSLWANCGLATGSTQYYDTEMMQFDVSGGDLPANLMIRESPTRASTSRAVARLESGGGYRIDSFFDIFLEVSTDGGATWQPSSINKSMPMLLQPTPPPEPLQIHCPPDMVVRATSSAGAVVLYPPPTTSGGTPPVQVQCVPPSGSTFPIGVTIVNCTAVDRDGSIATGSFRITVLRQLKKHFYADTLILPPNGMISDEKKAGLTYPGGILIRNLACREFDASVLPPAGGEVVHTFGSVVEMEVSFNYGLTWQTCSANGAITLAVTDLGPDGSDNLYGAEVTQFSFSGGTLPAGVMIRESPTKASPGEIRIEAVPGGCMIDSFFDIFTEISTDFGSTWAPASSAIELEMKADADAVPAVALPRDVFPPPNGMFAGGKGGPVFASGLQLNNIDLVMPTGWMAPPVLGGSQTHTFDLQLDFQFSTDGGATWNVVRAPGTMTAQITHTRTFGTKDEYDLMVTQLDAAGGDLPSGVWIRESPTKASLGAMTATNGGGGGGGGITVSSFFDIFIEISTDFGATWTAPTNGPIHSALQRVAPVRAFAQNLMPNPDGRYAAEPSVHTTYACGIVVRNVVCRSFSASVPPPLPGMATSHTFGSQVEMEVSLDGGLTFDPHLAPATVTLQMVGRLGGDGVTYNIDTETTQFSVSGGDLPSNIQIRESPTRQSLGRTTQTTRVGGGYDCDSFFDIYTEVSTDGGATWFPVIDGLMRLTLEAAPPPPLLTITAPDDQWALATGPAGAAVTYPPPTVEGGLPPVTVICNPPSGSIFPIGTTTVQCQASDSAGQFATDSFTVTVLPDRDLVDYYYVSETLPPEGGMHATPDSWFAVYPSGVVLRDLRMFSLDGAFPPPGPGASRTDTWHAVAEMEISFDSGMTYVPITGPATCTASTTCTGSGGGGSSFDTEMLQLDIMLPGGVLLRESPTKPSLGRAHTRPVTGGAMISSFFDIYTEVSLDSGLTWQPAFSTGILESRPEDSAVPDLPAPSSLLPPPGDRLVQRSPVLLTTSSGIVLTGVRVSLPSFSQVPPPNGVLQGTSYSAQADFLISLDGGLHFTPGRAPLSVNVATRQLGSSASVRFDTEMIGASLSGGDLPPGLVVRESPITASRGETVVRSLSDGTYRVASFFDVFLELSTDGGLTWNPSTSAPARLEEADGDTPEEYGSPNLLPLTCYQAALTLQQPYGFAPGVVVKSLVHRNFTQNFAPPAVGGLTQWNTFGSVVDLLVSIDGGSTFTPCAAPSTVTMKVSPWFDQGSTRHFDCEIVQFNIAGGGSLPGWLQFRESPTRPSGGRVSEHMTTIGTYGIESFFDIYLEVTTDGGVTWSPCLEGPITVATRLPTASENWRLQYFGTTLEAGSAADGADPDHDGQINLLEQATHTNPTQPNPPPATADTGSGHLVLTWTRDKASIGEVSIRVEYSPDLSEGSWIDCPTGPPVWDNGIVQGMLTTIPDVPGGKCFARLRVAR